MGQVTVIVNGRSYRLKCGDGEEQRLIDLAEHVRQRIDDLSYEFGHAGDERLLLMATLMITDELWDAKARLAALESRVGPQDDDASAAVETEQPLRDTEPADNVAVPLPAAPPPPAASKPKASEPSPPSEAAPFVQEPSLKRALRRAPAATGSPRPSLDDRLAEARDEPAPQPRNKTG